MKKIKELAIEIYYGQSKEIDLSVDDWIKKLEGLLAQEKKEILEKIEDARVMIIEGFTNKEVLDYLEFLKK